MLHGTGYTLASMRSTDRRWRRRIATRRTSRSANSISAAISTGLLDPVHLGVGQTQVQRMDVAGLGEVLPLELGPGQFHQGRHAGIGQGRRTELGPLQVVELLPVTDRSVPQKEYLVAVGHELGAQVGRRGDLVVRQ